MPTNVLILCTGNSARSILAEAILNRLGHGRFRAFSAGSRPRSEPNPFALELLAGRGYDVSQFRSKSWDEFVGPGAPVMDIVITVCDSAAGEACPYWPGTPVRAHWGLPDPAAVEGAPADIRAAFESTHDLLAMRIERLVSLDRAAIDRATLAKEMAAIGAMQGSTSPDHSGSA
jgi:arsenate reductase